MHAETEHDPTRLNVDNLVIGERSRTMVQLNCVNCSKPLWTSKENYERFDVPNLNAILSYTNVMLDCGHWFHFECLGHHPELCKRCSRVTEHFEYIRVTKDIFYFGYSDGLYDEVGELVRTKPITDKSCVVCSKPVNVFVRINDTIKRQHYYIQPCGIVFHEACVNDLSCPRCSEDHIGCLEFDAEILRMSVCNFSELPNVSTLLEKLKKEPIDCRFCSVIHRCPDDLLEHLKTHTENHVHCPFCTNTFTKRGLQRHIDKAHPDQTQTKELVLRTKKETKDNAASVPHIHPSYSVVDFINFPEGECCVCGQTLTSYYRQPNYIEKLREEFEDDYTWIEEEWQRPLTLECDKHPPRTLSVTMLLCKNIILLDCGHYFHGVCLHWPRTPKNCPQCGGNVTRVTPLNIEKSVHFHGYENYEEPPQVKSIKDERCVVCLNVIARLNSEGGREKVVIEYLQLACEHFVHEPCITEWESDIISYPIPYCPKCQTRTEKYAHVSYTIRRTV